MLYHLQAITANGIAAVLLCTLLVSCSRRYRRKSPSIKVFSIMLLINLFQCIAELLTILLDKKMFSGAVPFMTFLNSLLFMGTICFALLWSIYADIRVRSVYAIRPRKKTLQVLKLLPAAVALLGSFLNLFTPVFFRITPDNEYQRTGLFLITYGVTYFYLISGTITSYGIGGQSNKYVFLPALTFLAPVCLASILQFLFPGISLLWVGAAMGMNSAYLSLLDESASIDTLSGAFSRHYMNQYLSQLPKAAVGSKHTAGIMLDIDRFKSINDKHGHLAGDEAITIVGDLLRSAARTNGMVFRYAGDEFVVILTLEREGEIATFLHRLQEETQKFNAAAQKPYQITFSMGYTFYIPGESQNEFIKRMDDAMYADKNSKP